MSESASWPARLSRPLTPAQHRRIRVFLGLIPVIGWIVAIWSTFAFHMTAPGRLDRWGHIKGHDFVHFYMLGGIALDRAPQDLYNWAAQAARTDRLVPEYIVRYLPIHSPQVALFFAPLAKLPYLVALTLWLVTSAVLYAMCIGLIVRSSPALGPHKWLILIGALALPPFYSLIASGQTSAFALLWFTLAFLCLRADRPGLAGMSFGMLIYKPTLVLVFPVALAFGRQWRALSGFAVVAVLQFAIAAAVFGPQTLVDYVSNLVTGVNAIDQLESQPWQMHSLRALFNNSLPWASLASGLQIASSLIVLGLAVRAWVSNTSLADRFVVVLLATVLVSPHVYTYELIVLVPVYLMTIAKALARRSDLALWVPLVLAALLPALSLVVNIQYIQWSVIAMVWLFVVLISRTGDAPIGPSAVAHLR